MSRFVPKTTRTAGSPGYGLCRSRRSPCGVIEIRCAREAQDGPIFMLALAEEPDGGGWCLIFQSDEAEPGEYAVSTAEGATHYDAIAGWAVDDEVLTVRLTPDAAVALALPLSFSLRLDPAHVDVQAVAEALGYFAKPS